MANNNLTGGPATGTIPADINGARDFKVDLTNLVLLAHANITRNLVSLSPYGLHLSISHKR